MQSLGKPLYPMGELVHGKCEELQWGCVHMHEATGSVQHQCAMMAVSGKCRL